MCVDFGVKAATWAEVGAGMKKEGNIRSRKEEGGVQGGRGSGVGE